MQILRQKLTTLLRWSEKYLKTDMVYAAGGGFWLVAGKASALLIAMATLLAFGNFLPKETFGTYQYILSVSKILALFTLPGMGQALVRSIAQKKEGALKEVFTTKLRFGALGSLGLWAVAAWYFASGNQLLGLSFFLVGMFFALQNAADIFNSFWTGKKKFRKNAWYQIASDLLPALFIVPAIYLTDNLIYIVLVVFGSKALFNLVLYFLTQKKVENPEPDPEAISFGKNLTVMSAISRIANRIDKIILWQFLGPVQVAAYSFAQLPIQRVRRALPINALALPKLSEKGIKGRKQGILNKTWKLFFILVPIAAGVALLAPWIFRLLLPQYVESVKYLQVLTVIILLIPFQLVNSALIAEMRQKELYIIRIAPPLLKIGLLVVLVPFFEIWGAVIALLAGELVMAGLTLWLFWRI